MDLFQSRVGVTVMIRSITRSPGRLVRRKYTISGYGYEERHWSWNQPVPWWVERVTAGWLQAR